jgi:hypothetical protein
MTGDLSLVNLTASGDVNARHVVASGNLKVINDGTDK